MSLQLGCVFGQVESERLRTHVEVASLVTRACRDLRRQLDLRCANISGFFWDSQYRRFHARLSVGVRQRVRRLWVSAGHKHHASMRDHTDRVWKVFESRRSRGFSALDASSLCLKAQDPCIYLSA